MADNSKFVLRWEIDNATARIATGAVESGEFNEGGFKWTATLYKKNDGWADLTLRCGVEHDGPWKCEVKMNAQIKPRSEGPHSFSRFFFQKRFRFDEKNSSWRQAGRNTLYWPTNSVTLEFLINIIDSENGEPNRRSDVILKIGDNKLHVSKKYLSVHSPVFEALFFGNFTENGKEEVEVKDVVYEEFLDILNLIYSRTSKITDRTVLHILKLADRFQIEKILDESKMHLTQSKGFDVVKKLQIADQYNLIDLRDHCLQSFTSDTELKEKLKSVFDNFSDAMKVGICNRIMQF